MACPWSSPLDNFVGLCVCVYADALCPVIPDSSWHAIRTLPKCDKTGTFGTPHCYHCSDNSSSRFLDSKSDRVINIFVVSRRVLQLFIWRGKLLQDRERRASRPKVHLRVMPDITRKFSQVKLVSRRELYQIILRMTQTILHGIGSLLTAEWVHCVCCPSDKRSAFDWRPAVFDRLYTPSDRLRSLSCGAILRWARHSSLIKPLEFTLGKLAGRLSSFVGSKLQPLCCQRLWRFSRALDRLALLMGPSPSFRDSSDVFLWLTSTHPAMPQIAIVITQPHSRLSKAQIVGLNTYSLMLGKKMSFLWAPRCLNILRDTLSRWWRWGQCQISQVNDREKRTSWLVCF